MITSNIAKECNEDVHLCETDEQLITAIKNNWCVALYDKADNEHPTLPGDVETSYFFKY